MNIQRIADFNSRWVGAEVAAKSIICMSLFVIIAALTVASLLFACISVVTFVR